MSSSPDPLGKRALFYAGSAGSNGRASSEEPEATGRRALFSTPEPPKGPVELECASCGARTRLGYLELVRLLPLWLWLPWRRHPLLMGCPACRRTAWLAPSLRRQS